MGSTYTITTSDDEDSAIANEAGDPNVDKQVYLESCVHGQLLQPWVRRFWIQTSPVPPVDVATGYVTATPEQQQQVNDILGLTPTPPPDGGGGTPPEPVVTTYQYAWSGNAAPAANGQFRSDSRDWATATVLSLALQTADSQNVTAALQAVPIGATFHVEHPTDSTRFGDWTVSVAPTSDGASSLAFGVSVIGTGGSLPTGTTLPFTITVPAPPAARAAAAPERALTF